MYGYWVITNPVVLNRVVTNRVVTNLLTDVTNSEQSRYPFVTDLG